VKKDKDDDSVSVKEIGQGVKKFFDALDVRSYGYKVNRWLTNGFFMLIVLFALFIGFVDGFDTLLHGAYYYECPETSPTPCVNPAYDWTCELTAEKCEPEFIYQGESLGVKPSVFARSFPYVAVFILFVGLGLNHYLYNRKKVKRS
jgi:hypothetical protein